MICWCLLFVGCYLLFVMFDCSLLLFCVECFVVRRSVCVVRCWLLVVCSLLFVVCWLLVFVVVCWLLLACCVFGVSLRLSVVVCCCCYVMFVVCLWCIVVC